MMDDEEFTDICFAASSKQISHAIKNGANVNARGRYTETALMMAIINERDPVRAVKLLLEKGADVNAADNGGTTALMFAVQDEASPDIAEMLLKAGADVNAKAMFGDTALFDAAHWCLNERTLELLLDAGAEVKIKNDKGKMPIDYARENENLKGTKVLERLEQLSI